MKQAVERADPEAPEWRDDPWFNVILDRTHFARIFCSHARVLDAPCGVGWTSAKIAETAQYVLGVDYSCQAIELARRRYVADNLEFRVMDCLDLRLLEKDCFDVACSLEALEHFDRDDGVRYIDELATALRPAGTLVGTTPSAFTRHGAEKRLAEEQNQFHRYIWTHSELQHMLERTFADVWVCPTRAGYFVFYGLKKHGIKQRASRFLSACLDWQRLSI